MVEPGRISYWNRIDVSDGNALAQNDPVQASCSWLFDVRDGSVRFGSDARTELRAVAETLSTTFSCRQRSLQFSFQRLDFTPRPPWGQLFALWPRRCGPEISGVALWIEM